MIRWLKRFLFPAKGWYFSSATQGWVNLNHFISIKYEEVESVSQGISFIVYGIYPKGFKYKLYECSTYEEVMKCVENFRIYL
jgi:hypothetical protein